MRSLTMTPLAPFVFLILVAIGLWPSTIRASQERPPREPRGKVSPGKGDAKAAADEEKEGEKKFQTHCGRCHNAPEQISPRIAGSVVRHMRVRAILSAEDERQILQFLAP